MVSVNRPGSPATGPAATTTPAAGQAAPSAARPPARPAADTSDLPSLSHARPRTLPPRAKTWPLTAGDTQAMRNSPAHAAFQQQVAAEAGARRAASLADFANCCQAILPLPVSEQLQPWAALAASLAGRHASLPDDAGLAVRNIIIAGLEALPTGPQSAQKLAAPLLAAFDAIQGMHRRTLEPAHFNPAVFQSTTSDLLRLNQLIKQHGMQALPGPMNQLMDKFFGAEGSPDAVKVGLLMFPRRLAELEKGAVPQGYVKDMMMTLTRLAQTPAGIPSLQEEGWGSYVRMEIEKALKQHDIDVDAPVLREKLVALDPLDVVKPSAAG
jgi:hypothetical protein